MFGFNQHTLLLVALFSHYFIGQLFAQCLHAFSFGLFHLIAMRLIFQNFSIGQQGRGQALYSTMWGLGVAFGSILAGHYWKTLTGEHIFRLLRSLCYSVYVLYFGYLNKLKSQLLNRTSLTMLTLHG